MYQSTNTKYSMVRLIRGTHHIDAAYVPEATHMITMNNDKDLLCIYVLLYCTSQVDTQVRVCYDAALNRNNIKHFNSFNGIFDQRYDVLWMMY